MSEKIKKKKRAVAITPLAFDTLKKLVAKNPKEDGSVMSLCEMTSSLIMRASKQ